MTHTLGKRSSGLSVAPLATTLGRPYTHAINLGDAILHRY